MFKADDYVVYNSNGVYKIVDIRKEKDIENNEIEYYVLQPAYANNCLTIKTPVNNPKVMIREVITKEDVISLLAEMPEKESIWIDDDRQRKERFKTALRTGKSEEWIKLVKTIYQKKQERNDLGKKLMKIDEDIMKAAEKNLHEEFALALNISPEDVTSYIMDHIS